MPVVAPLVGRELELTTLCGMLKAPGPLLVTVTGPGGVGKSVLAEAAAAEAGTGFADVVWAADVEQGAELPDAAGRTLLILDDGEHGTAPPAAAVSKLLRRHDGLVVLATACEPLRLRGERLLPLAPLPVPPRGGEALSPDELRSYASVALFEERALDADPGFALTAENAEAVAALCALLDGLPVALELAAARLRLLPPQQLLARLRQNPSVLAGGPSGAPERHRSLAALARWSCRELGPGLMEALERLAVYEGGFALAPPAPGISPPVEESAVEELLDRGLVRVAGEGAAAARLAVPEPVRSYCRDRAAQEGRDEAARGAHAERCRQLVAAAARGLAGTEQARWLRETGPEGAEQEAAVAWLLELRQREAAAELLLGCRLPWLAHGRLRSGLRWTDRVADDAGAPLPEALRGRVAAMSAGFATALGDPLEGVRRYRRALTLSKGAGDKRAYALTSARLGAALLATGDLSGAQAVLVTALSSVEALGATAAAAQTGVWLAEVMRLQGNRNKAQQLLDRSVEVFRRIGDTRGLAGALRAGARMAAEGEEPELADALLREALRCYRETGERTELPDALEEFAVALNLRPGQEPRAVRLLAAADTLRRRLGAVLPDDRQAAAEKLRTALASRLIWADFATAWAEGVRLDAAGAALEALSAASTGRRAVVAADPATQTLTPRQVQVALLVGEGLTNRQIAARLELSEWTVVNHVRHIMRRLGCSSRVQVAGAVGRWA
ncbi:LuxR C-terminal-related transcriptional regulator [Streptomyces sp. NPDC051940]|uniref:ATP-binding protein n=1 Tax=Streptomyces sp. NPDC051940 TaxID=3155675 RepID=UPI003422305F